MRKLTLIGACLAVAASFGASGAFAEDGTPSPEQVANQRCQAEHQAMGNKAFKALYGKRAMQTCKGKRGKVASATLNNAAQECKAEQADPNFAVNHGGMTFDQVYGTNANQNNANQNNAFGKCVSSKVREQQTEDQENLQNASQSCRAERGDAAFPASHDGKSFQDFYGTNRNKRNAFGKCVSRKAHEAQVQPPAPTV